MRLPVINAALCVLTLSRTTQAAQCAAPPLNFPIRSLSVGPGMISHGIPVSIGTPPQQLVLTPSLQLDTTFIPRYTNSCVYAKGATIPANDTIWNDQDGKSVCARIYGGGYVPSLSTTFFDNGTNSPVSEAWFKKTRFWDWQFMTDSFQFSDYLDAYAQQNEAFPEKRNVTTSFIIPNEGATFGGLGDSVLSLTPDSRILDTLYTEGMVPSKSWSLTRESLCLGCVDENAYTGDFQDFKPADRNRDDGLPCLLQAKVESLDYHTGAVSDGTALLNNPFSTCIDPGVPFLIFPGDVRAKLSEAVGVDTQAPSRWSTEMVNNSSSFLRFKFEGSIEVDVAMQGIDEDVAKEMGEQDLSSATGAWGAYGEDVPVLGRPFTDSITLRWNEKLQEYGMAKRNSKTNENSNLKPLGCDDFPSPRRSVETTPSVGVIVGSIVGGFVAGLVFAAAAVFFYWRGQRGVKSKYEAMPGEDAVSLRTVDTGGRTLESRMSGPMSPPVSNLRESLRSHFGARSVSPLMEPYLVDDGQVYEAPEGGNGDPSKRDSTEMRVYSYDQR